LLRGGKYHHAEATSAAPIEVVGLDAIEEVA
jgi:hypothetical protein